VIRDKAASSGVGVFYALLVTQTVSLIGSQISSLSVGIAVFRHTGHVTPLGLVAFFNAAPVVLFSGFLGALADRFDRRKLMMLANLGLVAFNGLLLLSFVSGAFQLWHLYALSFINATFAALQTPAFLASVTMLVPDGQRDRANAIRQLAGPSAGVIAPGIAGLLYAIVGVAGAITTDIATFCAAILVLLLVRIPMPAQTSEGQAMRRALWRQAFDGFRYLGARPSLLGLLAYISFINFLLRGVSTLATPYILDRTGGTAALGLVMGALNAGGLAGGVVMSVWGGTRPRIHAVMPSIAIGAVFLTLGGSARSAAELGATLFLAMASIPIANASLLSIYQQKIAPDVQGRVFAAMSQLGSLLAPLAALLAGPLADKVFEPAVHTPPWRAVGWLVGTGPGAGMGLLFVIAGLLGLATSLIAYAVPASRRVEILLPDRPPALQPASG
jgi:DHA3 family macrolide efflux protein-like MFS transporter